MTEFYAFIFHFACYTNISVYCLRFILDNINVVSILNAKVPNLIYRKIKSQILRKILSFLYQTLYLVREDNKGKYCD